MQTITHNALRTVSAHTISAQVANFTAALQQAFNAANIKLKII